MMVQKTAIKNFTFIIIFLFTNLCVSQTDSNFYRLFKGGKKYKKIVGYIFLNDSVKKIIKDKNTIVFYIKQAQLEHRRKDHLVSSIKLKDLKKIKTSTLKELGEAQQKELERVLEEENIEEYPRPLNNKLLKIFLIEPIDCNNYRKIEVEWKYTI